MSSVIREIENRYKKSHVVDIQSGDTVKVHQKIKEGNKERVQIFQGIVIRVDKKNSLSARIVVRRITGGLGVEKSFLLHSPLVTKIEVTKRSKVRRNYLTYMRDRTGKSARLTNIDFDKEQVNATPVEEAKSEVVAEEVQEADKVKEVEVVNETTENQDSVDSEE